MAEKNYVGKARYHQFRDGGEICKIWITPEGLELINQNVDARGSINLIMAEMRQQDRAGNTHTLYIDDYVPNSRGQDDSRNQTRGNQYQGHHGRQNRDNGGFDQHADQYDYRQPSNQENYDPDADIPF